MEGVVPKYTERFDKLEALAFRLSSQSTVVNIDDAFFTNGTTAVVLQMIPKAAPLDNQADTPLIPIF